VEVFQKVFETLEDRGMKSTLNITDNQAVKPMKAFLARKDCKWQFVEPSNHHVNVAERAIQTFTNHFISGLCATNKNWPFQLWDQLTHQATSKLNLLRTSRIDPTKLAYEQTHGAKYNWNTHHMTPPGTRAIMYEAPASRASWGPRDTDAWCCGPELYHYWNCKFYVPETRSYRTSGSFDLFLQHCLLPEFTLKQHANEVHGELIDAIQKLEAPAKKLILTKLATALQSLSAANDPQPIQRVAVPETTEDEPSIQRVNPSPIITMSTNPTAPRTLKA